MILWTGEERRARPRACRHIKCLEWLALGAISLLMWGAMIALASAIILQMGRLGW